MATFDVDTWVWMPHEEDMALPAKVVDASISAGSAGKVKTEDGEVHELDAKQTEKLLPCHTEVLKSDVDNLIKLNDLNENAILHNLRIRFKEDLIYTYVSSILISVNPFKMLPLYTPEMLDKYKEQGARDLPPHVYSIADFAYRNMLADGLSQSCICSGESGAGKTEATKLFLQYLAEVSGGLSAKVDSSGTLEQQILQANPVMEAFGNAKTTRNNNSSRFGKLISIQFDGGGSIVGGSIINYLLEKSRVVGQSESERNYHIFYQILAGQNADEKLKAALKLGEPEDYQYTNQSGCIHIDGLSDEKEFEDVRAAMTSLKLSDEEQLGVFNVTGALLVAGNLEFQVVHRSTQEDASEIKNKDVLQTVASMLQVDVDDLNKSLTSRNIGAMSKILVAYSEEQAKDARDAMVKKVYSNLFNWLITKINATLSLGDGGATAKAQINVLDIFGFESFELNSFEQLCINYCNEKLQSHFNEHIFKLEQDEYKAQGVVVADTAFKDNQPCLDMLETKNVGVFSMLDEEISVPKGSDNGFLSKVLDRYVVKEKHPNMKRPKPQQKHSRESFIVDHYAGEVSYTVTGFLEKNKDALHDDIQEALMCSANPFVANLVKEPAPKEDPNAKKKKSRGGKAKRKPTLGEQFKLQLAELMATLKSTQPHFVRTMKPNTKKKGDIFMSEMMLEQLRYAGLLEVCRIRQIGYPVRRDFESFFNRFKPCVPSAKTLDDLTAGLTANGIFIDGEWAKGTNKIFMRNNQANSLEAAREDAFSEVTRTIQRSVRRMIARCKYLGWKKTLTTVEAAMNARDFELLQANVHLCDELPNYGKHLKLVRDAKVLLARLQEEDRIKTLIKNAIEERALSNLTAAVQAAEGMSPPLEDPIIGEAKAVIARLEEENKLIANIKKAIEARNLADLTSLLQSADDLDPPLNNDVTSQAQTLKTRLEEEAQVLAGLKEAISGRDLSNLRVFMAKMQEMGMDCPELAEGKKMQEILLKEQQAKTLLAEACENRKLESLVAAIKKAIELGLAATSTEISNAKALQGVLETEGKCTQRLKDACDARDLSLINAALEEAKGLEMSGQAVVSAGVLKTVLEKEEAATAQLKEAIASKDVEKLSEALGVSGSLGMDSTEVTSARALMAELGSKNAATSKLAAVSGSDDIAEIEAAIAEGEGLNLSASPEMGAAKAQLVRLKEEQGVLAALSAAVAGGDLAAINASMDKVTSLNMGTKAKYADAVNAGKEMQKKLDGQEHAKYSLSSAIKARDVDLLTSAIDEAKAAGVDTSDAEKLLPELKEESILTAELSSLLAGTDEIAVKASLEKMKSKGISNATVEQAVIRVDRGGAIEETLASLKKAQAEGDLATLMGGLEKMLELGYEDETVISAKASRDDLSRLDVFKNDLKAAISTLNTKRENRGGISDADVAPISEAIAKAQESGLPATDPIFVEANTLNNTAKEQLSVQTKLADALKTKKYTDLQGALDAAEELLLSLDDLDKVRVLLSETKVTYPTSEEDIGDLAELQKELFKKAQQKKYSFQQYSKIRTAEEFAKNVYLNKAKVKAEMLQWQNRLLTKSLLVNSKDYNKTAIRIHKSILGYMGDKTMSFPAALAEDILQKGLDLPDIVDEIYLQILKQLTKNPRAESIARGWQLMCMCVGTFPPSRDFQLYLLNFILLKAEIHGAVGNYARYSLRRLEGMLTSGPSGFVPSVEEIQAYKERPPILSTIELVDGTPLTEDLPITPDLNVEKVLEICTHFLELKDARSKDFGIFVVDTDEGSAPSGNTISQSAQELKLTPRPLRSEDYMGDVVVQKARQNRNHKFVFKRKIFLKNKDPVSEDEMFNRLIYLQAADEVISGNIPIEDEAKLIGLTTSCLVADLGEECPDTQEGMLENECIEWIPPQWKDKYTPEKWADLFLQGRDAAMDKGGEELQAEYVEDIRKHDLYGTHFFHVKKVNNPLAVKDLPDKVVAAFNSDGLHFLDDNRKILLSYGYADIYRWGGSSVQFSLIIWNAETQDTFELILTTYQAAHMAALILDFINAIMESTKA